MQIYEPKKKIFVRFFTTTRLFASGYRKEEGDVTPQIVDIPDMEVQTRELSELGFWIPDAAIGLVFYEIITAQVADNNRLIELSSGEINKSGRHFFQYGKDFGRVATRDEAREEYDQHTYMRSYRHTPLPKRIILYAGPHYYKHGYSFSGGRQHHTRESAYRICTFDFLETDVVVPIWYNFAQGCMIKAFAENKGWVKKVA